MKSLIYCVFNARHAVLVLLAAVLFYGNAFAAATWVPGISVDNRYSDNIDLTPDDEDNDLITTISPSIDFNLTTRLSEVSLSYSPTYAQYWKYSENDTWRHDAELSAERQITKRTRLEFSNRYKYTEEPLYETEEPIYEVDTTVRQGREPYYSNTSSLNAIHQFGPEDSVELGYEYYFLRNKGSGIYGMEDRNYHLPSLKLDYWVVPKKYGTETEISYRERNFDYTEDYNDIKARFRGIRRLNPHLDIYAEYSHEWTNYEDEGEDYQVYSPLLGFTWDPRPRYSFSGSLGFYVLDGDHGEDESGWKGTIETDYRWRRNTTLSAALAAGYDRASYDAEILGFNEFYSVSGSINHQFARRLDSYLSIDYRRSTYTELDPERDDDIWRINTGLVYQVLSWMNVEAYYVFRRVESDYSANDYVENKAGITVSMIPARPFLLPFQH